MSTKVNIVLVHGAWADGTSWSKVIPLLTAEGYTVAATQHPLTSLADDVEITRRLAEAQDGPVLLVGHSYGGAIITEAAGVCPNAVGLVYVAAFAPDAGETLGALGQRTQPLPSGQDVKPDKYGRLWIDKEKFREDFCGDVAPEEAQVMSIVQKPLAASCFADTITSAGWRKLPSWYQISENDRMIDPATEKFMAERMNAKQQISLPSSHCSMVSHPKEVAALILSAAKELSA